MSNRQPWTDRVADALAFLGGMKRKQDDDDADHPAPKRVRDSEGKQDEKKGARPR
jgi:hypothetical protein